MGKLLGILCPVCLRYRHHPSEWLGVEPITFYCFGPSKKPRQRDFLLLTLTKLVVNKHDQTCCLFFRHLTLVRGVVVNSCVLLKLVHRARFEPALETRPSGHSFISGWTNLHSIILTAHKKMETACTKGMPNVPSTLSA